MAIDTPQFVLNLLNNYDGMVDVTVLSDLMSNGVTEEVEPGVFVSDGRRIVCKWDYPQGQKAGLYGCSWKFEEDKDGSQS